MIGCCFTRRHVHMKDDRRTRQRLQQGRIMGDRLLDLTSKLARWLALPIVALLFLQWPLRQFPGGVSRLANDLGQILFAIYVAVAFTAATRAHAHIAIDALARHYSIRARSTLARVCNLVVFIPWAAFVLWAAAPMVLNSAIQLERFQDTGNPGYFLIRAAVVLLAALVAVAGITGLRKDGEPE